MWQWLEGRPVAVKLWLLLGIACTLSAFICVMGSVALKTVRDGTLGLTTHAIPENVDLADFDRSAGNAQRHMLETAGYMDATSTTAAVKADSSVDKAQDELTQLKASASNDPKLAQAVDDLNDRWAGFTAAWQHWKPIIISQSPPKSLDTCRTNIMDMYDAQISPAIDHVQEQMRASSDAAGKAAEATYSQAMIQAAIAIVIGGLILAMVAPMIIRMIVRPILSINERMEDLADQTVSRMTAGMDAFAAGDLTVPVAISSKPLAMARTDELGSIATSFDKVLSRMDAMVGSYNQARGKLSDVIQGLKTAAEIVAESSLEVATTAEHVTSSTEMIAQSMNEISGASDQAARGASEVAQGSVAQAHSISASADLMADLVKSISQVAVDAGNANTAASAAMSASTEGGQTIRQSLDGMATLLSTVNTASTNIAELGESSKMIGVIVDTINEIAEQTNLLALNAAIEAARAGEAGRGFAVVADEVRKLAERAGAATREISTLISRIQSQTTNSIDSMALGKAEVERQSTQAKITGETFVKIDAAFKAVTDRVHAIASTADVIAQSSDQVARAITEVSAITEESSAASEELSASAEEVSAAVSTVGVSTAEQTEFVRALTASSQRLSNVAQDLLASVSHFHTDCETQAPRVAMGIGLAEAKDRKPMLKAA